MNLAEAKRAAMDATVSVENREQELDRAQQAYNKAYAVLEDAKAKEGEAWKYVSMLIENGEGK